MQYRFPLKQLYRADYKDETWTFRTPNNRDLYTVSEWMALSVAGSRASQQTMYDQLLQEFGITAKIVQPNTWIVTVFNKRIFWLEVEDIPNQSPLTAATPQSPDAKVHLVAHPAHLRHRQAALILWRRATGHLLTLDTWLHLRVKLDASRDIEAQALEKLGFKKQEDHYIL